MIRRRFHPARAFSLFELLIVVGIIVILLAIIAPSIAELVKSNNYSAAVNQLSGTLEAARQLGFEQQGTARVRVRYAGRAPLTAMSLTQWFTRHCPTV